MVALILILFLTFMLFSTAHAPLFIPSNNVQGFPFLHILSTCFSKLYYSHPNTCKVVSFGFICIPLMISDTEHLSTCLLAIHMSSLKKYLFSFYLKYVQFNLKPIFKLGLGECFAVELYEFPILYINPTSLMAQW